MPSQPRRFAAEVEDAYSLGVNPAGLGLVGGSELRLFFARQSYRASEAEGYGAGAYWVLGSERFGFGLGWDESFAPRAAELQMSARGRLRAGFGTELVEGLAIGASYTRALVEGRPDLDLFDVGLTLRPFRYLSVGARAADLGEAAGRRSYDVSVAVRPGWERLLVSGQWTLTEGIGLESDTLELAARVEIEPIDGIRIGGGTNQDLDAFLQLAIDSGSFGAGAYGEVVDEQLGLGGELVFRSPARAGLQLGGTVAMLDLAGALAPEPELELLSGTMKVTPYQAAPLLLHRFATHPDVRGVYLRFGSLSIGWAKAQELRRGITRLREAGRRVDCFLHGAKDLSYFIASACDRVMLLAPTLLELDGLAMTHIYLGEALSRLGVKAEVERFGAYKNAPDQFTRADMSAEERETASAYMDEVWRTLVTGIADGRSMEEPEVVAAIDQGVLTPTSAVALGLVDELIYPDEAEGKVLERYGSARLRYGSDALTPKGPRAWGDRPKLAVIHVDAPITSGRSEAAPLGLGRTVGASSLVQALREAAARSDVKGIVLRVDSPGGDAIASDLVARAVKRAAEAKPLVASFGDVAASGGYYVAAPAQRIFAESTSLTGSIGIYSVKLDLSALLERLGIGVSQLTRGALAGNQTSYVARSEAGDAAMRRALASLYQGFLQTVADGRDLSLDQVRAVAEGRVFSGRAAMGVGLVDSLGGLHDAATFAAEVAGYRLSELEVLTLPGGNQGIGNPLGALGLNVEVPARSPASAWLRAVLGPMGAALDARLPLLASEAPLALLPAVIELD